ncbi:MAG: DNA ligase, partial [Fulvivirga sp.]|nr:DNA ligase [Fulvivirga sp.]
LKFKCVNRQELVIGGFTDPHGERVGFGALLVGYYEDGTLKYAGKVGTGYNDEQLKEMRNKMDGLERESNPFDENIDKEGVHFISPKLVGEFGFTEWTDDGKLRHPRFIGLRDDKAPEEVVKEQ